MSGHIKKYAELEIGLSRGADATCGVELRFTHPESETEIPPAHGEAALDASDFLEHHLDAEAYSKAWPRASSIRPRSATTTARSRSRPRPAACSLPPKKISSVRHGGFMNSCPRAESGG